MTTFPASFRANAGIKDIVGRGLIYDDNIAIIELVKNSKDAGSPDVNIEFKNILDEGRSLSEIIICDRGSGMSRDDILNKWLNIAFSEKKNKNSKNKIYAGNKGVGRFSCDRLGRELVLYTRSLGGEYIKLPIIWGEFENKGAKDEISTIALTGEVLEKSIFLKEINNEDFLQGTVLKIQSLRSNWSAQKLKKLINDLEKFSPSLDENFAVYLYSDTDYDDQNLKNKINKKIDNGILSKLAFKTTYIKSEIDSDGEFIFTDLFFQGRKIYSYKAVNPYQNIKNIKIEIHYLDTLSKTYFTKTIGINANSYGSVFLFYNGFRISPYGNEKNDWLGLDQRKSQGKTRNLGTREIFGRIDISDFEEQFSVITSREGLAHNAAFYDLIAYDKDEKAILSNGKKDYGYATIIIRQLENFVVNGLSWNRLLDKSGILHIVTADDARKDPDRFTIKALSPDLIKEVCEKVIKSNLDITSFDIDYQLISEIQAINEEKYQKFISDFVKKTSDKSLSDLNPNEKGVVKRIVESEIEKKNVAIEERNNAEKKVASVSQALAIEKKKGLYLLSTRRTLSEDADGLIHTMKINNIEIKDGIDILIDGLNSNQLSKHETITKLGNIKLYALKTLKMAELATRSGFDRDIEVRSIDIAQYIIEYIEIYKHTFGQHGVKFEFILNSSSMVRSISVLNLSIVIDNLISNSVKWGAQQVRCEFHVRNNLLELIFSDNGYGLSESFLEHADSIFDLGVRDEPPEDFGGSGIGLYFSRKLLSDLNAEISFIGNGVHLKGAAFKVVFK